MWGLFDESSGKIEYSDSEIPKSIFQGLGICKLWNSKKLLRISIILKGFMHMHTQATEAPKMNRLKID